ncbi:MAG: AmmeMemoRadiSam system protein B [Magnetococcales bacterium]|nr:AmmeMemoRadiSam system protein B [Magnetococcales bacterium]
METQTVRPPAVAGTFYPGDPQQLRSMIHEFLSQAKESPQGEPPAFISPHAGYVYSGQIAAYGYKNLKKSPADNPRRIFVLAPSHKSYLDGISVGNYLAYRTPLGEVTLDHETIAYLAAMPDVLTDPQSHALDHALEVQLPFLQETVVNFKLVPIMFGDISGGHLADILEKCWQPEDLIIISSDLSHFHPYNKALELDQSSHNAVLSQQPRAVENCDSCGRTGMAALSEIARRKGWQPSLAKYCNSGDTAGRKDSVVGYATYLFYPKSSMTKETAPPQNSMSLADIKPHLPSLARNHLENILAGGKGLQTNYLIEKFPPLAKIGATFITLTKNGQLRGCIGSLSAQRSLAEDLLINSYYAATKDSRFPTVTHAELATLKIEVSLLSDPKPLLYQDGADLINCLKPGIHGVILQKDGRRSTFLPQVWDQMPNTQTFLQQLCLKAGLNGNCWQNNPQISLYTVDKVKE